MLMETRKIQMSISLCPHLFIIEKLPSRPLLALSSEAQWELCSQEGLHGPPDSVLSVSEILTGILKLSQFFVCKMGIRIPIVSEYCHD